MVVNKIINDKVSTVLDVGAGEGDDGETESV
jgi:hypothetical protein